MTTETPLPVIAIDGTAASGKGTIARRLAKEYGFAYLDTGLLYRAVGIATLMTGHDPADRTAAIECARALRPAEVLQHLDDPELRSEVAGHAASVVSTVPEVRLALLDFQRIFALHPPGGLGAVLDGRDIGTVICPDAVVKIYVTASPEERARRLVKRMGERGQDVNLQIALADINVRDARDQNRAVAPLKPAEDAVILDTTTMGIQEAYEAALAIARIKLPQT